MSFSLSLLAVFEALMILKHDCIERTNLDNLLGGAEISNCRQPANEWCMMEYESIMVDKGLIYMLKV